MLGESLEVDKRGKASHQVQRAAPVAGGLVIELKTQNVGDTRYFGAVGFKGRLVGLGSAVRG
ncbi:MULTISPECIES: hypothetical protein [Pseudomonas]|uniref:hypothetical protein n=1 Tax=Pseudomonas TaxID=286 RepID=UPI0002D9B168|nr:MULTISPECIES: hypothetical protein [Pseudomonas]MDC7831058.1 hypothetical protein [Pseudomonas benzopyrenica]